MAGRAWPGDGPKEKGLFFWGCRGKAGVLLLAAGKGVCYDKTVYLEEKGFFMKIWSTVNKIPAGPLIVPTIIGAVIHTFCPKLLLLGNPTEGLFTSSGIMIFVGLMLFFVGAQLRVSDLLLTLRRGVPFCLVKNLLGYGVAFGILALCGQRGVAGIAFIALAAALPSCNGVLYAGIIAPWADAADNANFVLLALCSVPVVPLLLLGGASGQVDLKGIVSMLVPLAVGFVLGNLDEDLRTLFAGGTAIILPFAGFQFGSVIDLFAAARQIPAGLLLTALYYLVACLPLLAFETLVQRRPGYAAIASCSLAGITLSLPTLAAAVNSAYAPYVETTTAQLACVMVITTFLTPTLTSLWMKRRRGDQGTAIS